MEFEIAVKTDTGKVRAVNEDYVAFDERMRLTLVCDGMGGHRGGEKASRFAGQFILSLFQSLERSIIEKITGDVPENLPEKVRRLIAAIRLTNRKLFQLSGENENLRGMGATLAALLIGENFFAAANIGDSRIYRVRRQKIEQISVDHTFLNELVSDGEISPQQAEKIPRANVITRALGLEPTVKIDIRVAPANASELFLLCTDGLTRALSDEEILRIVQFNRDHLAHLAQHLVDDAAMRDGADNISVAAVKWKNRAATSDEISANFLIVPEEPRSILKTEDRFWRRQRHNEKINQIFQIVK
ncbi:MAG: serine/threonine-protein phosphatase [Calditrichaeota bacterium]|nr:serine/threonine-protein phosphatase [Calditrichota bacterium]